MNESDGSPLAGDDEPHKYSTGSNLDGDDEQDEEPEETDEQAQDDSTDDADLIENVIQEFVTDSLWAGTLRPDDVHQNEAVEDNPEEWVETADYRDDMLYMEEETSTGEVIEFMRRCIENPVTVDGKVVWNFSTHEIDPEAIAALRRKEQDRFVIPYQVTGAWGFMFTLLPEEIRDAEILIYDPADEEYMAYRSLHRTTAEDRMEQIRYDLSRRMVAESGDVLGLID